MIWKVQKEAQRGAIINHKLGKEINGWKRTGRHRVAEERAYLDRQIKLEGNTDRNTQ